MKKLINAPENYVEEMLTGLVAAHPTISLFGNLGRVVAHAGGAPRGKVGIVTGGGSGHLPLFCGYVGPGLVDACAIGNVFEGPTMAACEDAIAAADGGAGVLCLYGNYGGDRMNFDMAIELAQSNALPIRTVLGTDDIASADPAESHKRRGVAGIVFAYKAAGAAAASGMDLEGVTATAQHAVDRTRTIGLGLAPCTLPGAAAPSFSIDGNDVEMGIGIHGEPGIWREPMRSADTLVDEMIDRILADRPDSTGNRVAVLVNSLGATPLEELYIAYRRVADRLDEKGLIIAFNIVGPYVTSMEMAGISISVCFLDDTLEGLLKAPAACPFWQVAQ